MWWLKSYDGDAGKLNKKVEVTVQIKEVAPLAFNFYCFTKANQGQVLLHAQTMGECRKHKFIKMCHTHFVECYISEKKDFVNSYLQLQKQPCIWIL